jgi:hypothetical protein
MFCAKAMISDSVFGKRMMLSPCLGRGVVCPAVAEMSSAANFTQ